MVPSINLLTIASIYGDGSWLKSLLTHPVFVYGVALMPILMLILALYCWLIRRKNASDSEHK